MKSELLKLTRFLFLALIFSLIRTAFFVKHIKFEKREELKKTISEEIIPVVWYRKGWWDWYMAEDDEKEIITMFVEGS